MPNRLTLSLLVNGQQHEIKIAPDTPLLYVLRNDLGLTSPKYGCGLGECGACTVLVDGVAARSCVTTCASVQDLEIVTLEGLSENGQPNFVQQAFIDSQAAQCGYCMNGMIMTIHALLLRNPQATEEDIRNELNYNLCRCGTHIEILSAARTAAKHAQSN